MGAGAKGGRGARWALAGALLAGCGGGGAKPMDARDATPSSDANGPTPPDLQVQRSDAVLEHRVAPESCSPLNLDAGSPVEAGALYPRLPDGGFVSCASDPDCPPCASGEEDHCLASSNPLMKLCVCDQCATDSQCGPGGVCACHGTAVGPNGYLGGNVCLAGNCRVDDDCGPGGACSATFDLACGTQHVAGYFCHTERDRCFNDGECRDARLGHCHYLPGLALWGCEHEACTD